MHPNNTKLRRFGETNMTYDHISQRIGIGNTNLELVLGKFGIGHLADVFSSWLFSTVCFQMCPSMCPQLSHCRCIFQLARIGIGIW